MISIRNIVINGAITLVLSGMMHDMRAMSLVNFSQVYYRQALDLTRRTNVAVVVEGGFDAKGFDAHSDCVNVLQLYNPSQSSLAMLKGFDESSPQGALFTLLDAEDDGVRGRFAVTGTLHSIINGALITRVGIRHGFMFGVYVPFFHAQLSDVCWRDLTKQTTVQDQRVREELTNNFCANSAEFDENLALCTGWDRTGLGDITGLMEWQHDFPQAKPVLKIVQINTRLGLTLPTGLKSDSNKLYAFPFGNDGATGLLFGGCLGLNFMHRLWAGVDVELTHLFDNTSVRRIKVDPDQTDFLLLAKACVHNNWGMIQRFNLYLSADPIIAGLSCSFYYQFLKQGRVDLVVSTNDYDSVVANTAEYLKESVSHTAILRARYDFGVHLDEETRIKPSLSLFARIPFKGRRSVVWSSCGAMFDIAF